MYGYVLRLYLEEGGMKIQYSCRLTRGLPSPSLDDVNIRRADDLSLHLSKDMGMIGIGVLSHKTKVRYPPKAMCSR